MKRPIMQRTRGGETQRRPAVWCRRRHSWLCAFGCRVSRKGGPTPGFSLPTAIKPLVGEHCLGQCGGFVIETEEYNPFGAHRP